MCVAKSDVRFTPNSDHKSEFPHKVMSALPPKADMCGATSNVRFGPKADIGLHSISSSVSAMSVEGMVNPSFLAVLRLITNSNLIGCSTGKSEGLAPLKIRST